MPFSLSWTSLFAHFFHKKGPNRKNSESQEQEPIAKMYNYEGESRETNTNACTTGCFSNFRDENDA